MFSIETRAAILATGEQLKDADTCSALDLAELVLDADRVAQCGFPDANAEIGRLIEEQGFRKVWIEAANLLRGR